MIERSVKPVPNQNTTSRRPEKENWEDLWRVGPGTPMGTIMREYWQPALLSEKVAKGKAVPVRLLGEWFTVYRGEDDSVHAVASHCPHRGTRLDVGWVEGNQIRCGYHGWRFDGTGQCTDMPAELESFAQKVKIPAYPAYDYGGIIYVYMGEGEAPEFPRKYEIDNAKLLWSYRDLWPCNWLQSKENSFDPLHVVFVHRVGFGAVLSAGLPKIECTETDWGFVCKAVRPKDERIVETHFPNGSHVIVPQPNDFHAPWIDLFVCAAPVDDEHFAWMGTYASPIDGPEADELRRFLDHPVPAGADARRPGRQERRPARPLEEPLRPGRPTGRAGHQEALVRGHRDASSR